MPAEGTLIDYYARRAREYERIYHKPERQADLEDLRSFVGRTFAGRQVLEVAAGTGYWTEILSRSAHRVTAVDINSEVLEIARHKPLEAGKVRFEQRDVYQLPDFGESFDGAFAGFWWSHIPQARRAEFLRALHQILAPGATVVFIDNLYVDGNSTPISRTDADGNTYQERKLEDGRTFEVLKNYPSEAELRAAVAPVSSTVSVRWLPYYWVLHYEIINRP